MYFVLSMDFGIVVFCFFCNKIFEFYNPWNSFQSVPLLRILGFKDSYPFVFPVTKIPESLNP